jgi:LCP family protein required for cell wall assembly
MDTALGRIRFRTAAKRTSTFIVLAVLVVSAWIGWRFYAATAAATGNNNPLQLLSAFSPADLKQTNGRVNILVAGYSADDPGHSGAQLTDSIMILSINPTTKDSYVLSVPRDLWVNIPDFGYSKINAAYADGESQNFNQTGYFNGGMGLLQEVIQDNLGVNLNYYSLINYTAVKDAVNAVGGVSVTINSSDPRGLYDPYTNLKLPNGSVTLNGQQALDLMRSRGDGAGSYGFDNGDFDRIKDQQVVLLALKSKMSSLYSNPLKIVSVVSSVGSNVKTDLQLNEMETLYSLIKDVNASNIKTYSLQKINGQQLLTSYTSYSGQSALIPFNDDFSQIQNSVLSL